MSKSYSELPSDALCQRSLVHFYRESHNIKMNKTSCTYGKHCDFVYAFAQINLSIKKSNKLEKNIVGPPVKLLSLPLARKYIIHPSYNFRCSHFNKGALYDAPHLLELLWTPLVYWPYNYRCWFFWVLILESLCLFFNRI